MKLVIPRRLHFYFIRLSYLLFPLVGWVALDVVGIMGGLIAAYLLDRFYPRCMTSMSWEDVSLGVENFLEWGFLGSHMYIHIGSRSVYVHRVEIRGQATLSLQLNRWSWSSLLDDAVLNGYLGKWCDVLMPDRRWKIRNYVSLMVAPEREDHVESVVSMVKDLVDRCELDVSQLYVRVDYARKPIRALFEMPPV